MINTKKILVIAPHPDDEILGVGGAIINHVKDGDKVFVCIATKPHMPDWSADYIELKKTQQKQVDNLLGVSERFNLDYPTAKLNTIPHGEISKKFISLFKEIKPDIVYAPYEHDVHLDHTIIFRSVMVASRPPTKLKLIVYETPSETEWNNVSFNPNFWIDIGNSIGKKLEAFSIYDSEVKSDPHPRSLNGVKSLARLRGAQICVEFAESFIIIKEYA